MSIILPQDLEVEMLTHPHRPFRRWTDACRPSR